MGSKSKNNSSDKNAKNQTTKNSDDTQSVHSSTATPNTTQNIDSDVIDESEIDIILRDTEQNKNNRNMVSSPISQKSSHSPLSIPKMVEYSDSSEEANNNQINAQS